MKRKMLALAILLFIVFVVPTKNWIYLLAFVCAVPLSVTVPLFIISFVLWCVLHLSSSISKGSRNVSNTVYDSKQEILEIQNDRWQANREEQYARHMELMKHVEEEMRKRPPRRIVRDIAKDCNGNVMAREIIEE